MWFIDVLVTLWAELQISRGHLLLHSHHPWIIPVFVLMAFLLFLLFGLPCFVIWHLIMIYFTGLFLFWYAVNERVSKGRNLVLAFLFFSLSFSTCPKLCAPHGHKIGLISVAAQKLNGNGIKSFWWSLYLLKVTHRYLSCPIHVHEVPMAITVDSVKARIQKALPIYILYIVFCLQVTISEVGWTFDFYR